MEKFGKFCFAILAMFLAAIIGGYLFTTFWSWFIVPTFEVKSLGLLQSIGVVFFINYLKGRKKDTEDFEWNKLYIELLSMIVWAAIVLTMGYIITLFQ